MATFAQEIAAIRQQRRRFGLRRLAERDGIVTDGGRPVGCGRCGGSLLIEATTDVVCLLCGERSWLADPDQP